MIGQSIAHYKITAKLGEGGMGEVFRATDSRLDRQVALKLLPAAFTSDPQRMARFQREAKMLASLNHPNIGAIYGLEERGTLRVLVLELIEGEDLAERIARGSIPVTEALKLALQIAAALEAAHEKGIIHRDLKPDNVRITPEGTVKVLDFGLAKGMLDPAPVADLSQSPTLTAQMTEQGVILGTAGYMSPEQARGQEADKRADIWAFGVILWEMLAGKRAFTGNTAVEKLAAVLDREPDQSLLPGELSRGIHRLLRRCLSKEPAVRLRDIGDARLEIEEALSGASVETEAWDRLSAARPPAWRRHLHAGATVLFLLVSSVLGYRWVSHVPPEGPVTRFEIPPPDGTTFNFDPHVPGPAVVSPDGRMVAISARDGEGELRLYVRPLETTEARLLAGTDGAFFPFWSPDSQSIGFFAHGKLKKVEAAGGTPISLCDSPSGGGGSWNSEGVIVFAPGSSSPLYRVSEAGGESTPITQLDSERKDTAHLHPRFLPDGRRFLYLAQVSEVGAGEAVLVGSLDDEEEKFLLRSGAQADFASGYLLFLQHRTLMARPFDPQRLEFRGEALPLVEKITVDGDASHAVFSVAARGVLVYHAGVSQANSKLQWFDREGGSRGSLGEPAGYVEIHLSPDASHAAASLVSGGARELWIYELARNIRTRFAFGSHNWLPSWSPDGSELVFTSLRSKRFGLYRKSLKGAGEEKLLFESSEAIFPEGWSPDGKLLAFDRQSQDTSYDVWILPLQAEREPYPFVQTPFEDTGAAFSPDGKWLAYQSNEKGRWEVYVTPFPGPGRKWQISTGGGAWSRWRGDGKEIFYHGLNGQLMAVEVAVQDDTFVVGAAEALFAMRQLGPFYSYAVTRDGQRFLVVSPERREESSPLTLVLNWTAELDQA